MKNSLKTAALALSILCVNPSLFSVHFENEWEDSLEFWQDQRLEVQTAGLIDLPNPREEIKIIPYNQLRCTPEDLEKIRDIIVTIGTYSGAAELVLLAHYSRLNSHEKTIRYVHPLKFLEVVFLDPEMRSWMPHIMNGFFTKKGFLGDENTNGIAQKLSLNAKLNRVECYRVDFAKSLNLDPEEIRPYFNAEDWEALITFLIHHVKDPQE